MGRRRKEDTSDEGTKAEEEKRKETEDTMDKKIFETPERSLLVPETDEEKKQRLDLTRMEVTIKVMEVLKEKFATDLGILEHFEAKEGGADQKTVEFIKLEFLIRRMQDLEEANLLGKILIEEFKKKAKEQGIEVKIPESASLNKILNLLKG